MAVQEARDPWRISWQIATCPQALALILAAIAVLLLAAAALPQVTADDPAWRTRELFAAQARFGAATVPLQTLGLLHLSDSAALRILLALLGACLMLRLAQRVRDLRDHFRQRAAPQTAQGPRGWPWEDLLVALAHAGALVALLGVLFTALWGWRGERLAVQAGERLVLGSGRAWVELSREGAEVSCSPSLVATLTEGGPGLRIRAVDAAGSALALQQTPEAEPVTELPVALLADPYTGAREAQLAIPAAGLVLRLTPQMTSGGGRAGAVLVQAYSSPSGRLAFERLLTEDETEIQAGDTLLSFSLASYALLAVAFSPGRYVCLAGLVLLALGLVGAVLVSLADAKTTKPGAVPQAAQDGEPCG